MPAQIRDSLKVCHISTLTRWGGVERLLVDFLIHAEQKQIQHKLITTSSAPEIVGLIKDAHIDVFEPKRRFHYDPGAILQMAKWLRSQKIDIVHSYNAFANAWGNFAAMLARTPIYLTYERGTIWGAQPPLAWFDHFGHRRAKLVIANSQASAKLLELKYSIPSSKIRVVYNAVPDLALIDVQRARSLLGVKQDIWVIGSIGRLDTPKDYATFIEAAAFVLKERKDVIFVLVGGGPLEAELQAYIDKLGLREYFIVTGQRVNARELMQGFDIFVSTSIRESFGNALIEAALCAKPVIASAIDGVPEVVVHGETGILLNPTKPMRHYASTNAALSPKYVLLDGKLQTPQSLDPRMLANEIVHMLNDSELRIHLGQNACQRAQRLFSIERYISELEQIYLNVSAREYVVRIIQKNELNN